MQTFVAWYKSSSGTFKAELPAQNIAQAKALFEAIYGKNVWGITYK